MATLIPLGDASRRPRRFAVVTLLIILTNAYVFLRELIEGDAFVARWALIPARIDHGQGLITLVTGTFLHAGWLHILGNMVFLWAFGPGIEDAMGRVRYLVFYLIGGVVAMLAQVAGSPGSHVPCLGASGAIAGVMGAYLVKFPRSRVEMLFFFFFIFRFDIPAWFMLAYWFAIQLMGGLGATNAAQGGTAFFAHVGGFIAGIALVHLLGTRQRWSSHRDLSW